MIKREKTLKRIFITLSVVIAVLVMSAILWFFVSLGGGIEGIVHNSQKLPDFSKGEPAQNREQYLSKISEYDNILAQFTSKKYQPAVNDGCARSQYNFKVKTPYLSSCRLRYENLYLTNIPPCESVQQLKKLLPIKQDLYSECINNDTRYYKTLSVISDGDNTLIKIISHQVASNGTGIEVNAPDPHITNHDCHLIYDYCTESSGDQSNRIEMVKKDNYATVIMLESSKDYYMK